MSATSISFNNYSLQNDYFHTQSIRHLMTPDRSITISQLSKESGGLFTESHYLGKTIEIEGMLKCDTQSALEDKIDELKKSIIGELKNLDIGYGSGTRRYKATCKSIEVGREAHHLTITPYRIIFVCADPFGYATSSGIANTLNIADGLKNLIVTVSGSYNTKPSFVITVTSGNTFNQLQIKNDTTLQEIITAPISGNFNGGDEIIVNSNNKTVRINASGIDYTGVFPDFVPGENSLTITTQANYRKYDFMFQYPIRYL